MKSTKPKQPLTLLVLRDAQHAVKQIHLSKPLLIIVPTVAILSLSGLIISMQVNSSQVISKMEQEMHLQNMTNHQMEITVNNREEAISRLQNEIIQLSSDAHDMKDKMQRVSELEQELKQFIKKNDSSMIPESDSNKSVVTNLTSDLSLHVGGEFIAVHSNDIVDLSQETQDDFEEIRKLLDSMENNIPRTLEKAQETQDILEGIPNMWPTPSHVISSSFGYRKDPFTGRAAYHAGIDISGNTGDPVYAAGAGTVLDAEQLGARGLYIKIQHPDGLQTSYMHLNSIKVSVGDHISKGEVIGELGNTGRSTGSHLHFQIEKKTTTVNPLPYIE
jgi:murein DD-endopeptidase MepM/ murein hydrolase activator NlpD